MRALKGSTEGKALIERYVCELNEQEDGVHSRCHEITAMQQRRDAAQGTLNTMVKGLEMETTV